MAAINTMYQYSLSSYLGVFNYSLSHSLPDSHLPKRLKNIIDTLTLNVYNYACTGKRRGEKRGRCDRENMHVEGEEIQIYVHVQIFSVFYRLEI